MKKANELYEKSCGAIVFKVIDGEVYYLLEKMVKGHYSFPKGHMEKKETEDITALREIKEEVGIDVWLDTRYRGVITYKVKNNVTKDNVYFVARYLNGDVTIQESEVSEAKWLDEASTIAKLKTVCDKTQMEVYLDGFKFIKENYL